MKKVAELTWDFCPHLEFYGGQKSWNQSLRTKINAISNYIFQVEQGRGNLIICHPDEECLIRSFDNLKPIEKQEYPGYSLIGSIDDSYIVLSSPDLKPGQIIVTRVDPDYESSYNIDPVYELSEALSSELNGNLPCYAVYGVINVLNHPKIDKLPSASNIRKFLGFKDR